MGKTGVGMTWPAARAMWRRFFHVLGRNLVAIFRQGQIHQMMDMYDHIWEKGKGKRDEIAVIGCSCRRVFWAKDDKGRRLFEGAAAARKGPMRTVK